jgi:hypothetical protein
MKIYLITLCILANAMAEYGGNLRRSRCKCFTFIKNTPSILSIQAYQVYSERPLAANG